LDAIETAIHEVGSGPCMVASAGSRA